MCRSARLVVPMTVADKEGVVYITDGRSIAPTHFPRSEDTPSRTPLQAAKAEHGPTLGLCRWARGGGKTCRRSPSSDWILPKFGEFSGPTVRNGPWAGK